MQLSSHKNKILVFSDSHQDINKVQNILKREDYDTVVCLGDWFDSHTYDTPTDAIKTCEFLKEYTFKTNFHTCFGNHDMAYLFNDVRLANGGYTRAKNNLVQDLFKNYLLEIRKRFKWYIWIDDYLCTHAGINPYYLPPRIELNKEEITNWLNREVKYAETIITTGGAHWFYTAGKARCGRAKVGGLVWQDFDEEFEPISGLNQIVGHTTHQGVVSHGSNYGLTNLQNLDIDCHLNEYLIILNGQITVKKFLDL